MLILASASPRRRELLHHAGIPHTVHPAHIDEAHLPGEPPTDFVRRLALEKGHVIAAQHPESAVLAADTTVALDDLVLNKPADLAEAERMLRMLAGRTHFVHTGIAVLYRGSTLSHVETTAVTFDPMAAADLADYVASGDSLDKAGGYGIQGYAARWISRIEGDFFNVVGLPIAATVRLLREANVLP